MWDALKRLLRSDRSANETIVDDKTSKRAADALAAEVETLLSTENADGRQVVTAVAGLLAAVAHADRNYDEREAELIREELERFKGMDREKSKRLAACMEANGQALAAHPSPAWIDDLVKRTDIATRADLFGVLLDLASSDHAITRDESDLLASLGQALSLDDGWVGDRMAQRRKELAG